MCKKAANSQTATWQTLTRLIAAPAANSHGKIHPFRDIAMEYLILARLLLSLYPQSTSSYNLW